MSVTEKTFGEGFVPNIDIVLPPYSQWLLPGKTKE